MEAERTETLADLGSSGMFEAVSVEIADKIYRQMKSPNGMSLWQNLKSLVGNYYIETQDYILLNRDDIDAINKRTGERFTVVPNSQRPSESRDWDNWVFHRNTVFVSSKEHHTVYKIDIEGKAMISLAFRVAMCQWATNGKYFALNNSGKVTCVDMEQRKKYDLQHEVTGGGDSAILCTDTALYFVTDKIDSKGSAAYELVEYSFLNKVARTITTLPKCYGAKALTFYKDKLFMLLKTAIEEDYYGYNLSYVDIVSGSLKHYYPCQSAVCTWRSSAIKEYAGGWFFVPNKTSFPIEKFDFETMEFVTVAEGCGYSEYDSSGLFGCGRGYWSYYTNKIVKIGQWLYFKREKEDVVRVSLYQPMQTEVLQKEVEGVDL